MSADQVVADINRMVESHLWMDFSVWEYNGSRLEISGSIDESYQSNLRVVFEDVLWASIRFQGWHSDTSRPVLILVEGEEARRMNLKFQIEIGYTLFQFLAENYDEPMWITARDISADFTKIDLLWP